MEFYIVGLGLEEEQNNELSAKKHYFNCEYINASSCDEINDLAKKINNPLIIAINIDKYDKEAHELSAKMRSRMCTFVIYASQKNSPDERLRWLSLGATTNITIPFYGEELIRRAINLVRTTSSKLLIQDEFLIDLKKRTVIYGGEVIKFPPRSYDLLVYFLEHSGKVVSRQDIMFEIFGTDQFVNDRAVDSLIKTIRSKTRYDIIKTVRGSGYLYITGKN